MDPPWFFSPGHAVDRRIPAITSWFLVNIPFIYNGFYTFPGGFLAGLPNHQQYVVSRNQDVSHHPF